jgi:hypothetical protein
VFPLGGGREGVPDPVDRLPDKPGVAVLALNLQITLPGGFAVGALDERTHEGKVANVELSRGIDRLQENRDSIGRGGGRHAVFGGEQREISPLQMNFPYLTMFMTIIDNKFYQCIEVD